MEAVCAAKARPGIAAYSCGMNVGVSVFRSLRQVGVFGDERLWLGCGFSLGGFHLVLQSALADGVAFDPFPLQQDRLPSAEVHIGGG